MLRIKSWFAVIGLALLPAWAAAKDPLSVAEVEKVAKQQGLKIAESKTWKEDREFLTPQNQAILFLKINTADLYATWKSGYGDGAKPLAGIGDDAFMSSAGGFATVCFRRKTQGICVMPGFVNGRFSLTEPQIIELAKIAAANL